MREDLCKCGKMKRLESKQCKTCFLEGNKNKTEKLCRGCSQVLPIEEFRKKPDGIRPRSRCKKCEADSAKKWRTENPEENRRRKRQWKVNRPESYQRSMRRRGWKKLGLDPDVIEPQYNAHDKKCDCCGEETDILYTDHCHSTDCFRGFLCSGCNIGLGQFKDNPARLQKAIEYLRTRPSFPNIQGPLPDQC